MKTVFIALVLALSFAAPAHATSPIRTPRAVLELVTGGGFIPYGVIKTEIILKDDGNVVLIETTRDRDGSISVQENNSVWYFEPEVMRKIQAALTLLTPQNVGSLVDPDAKAPICMDAPGTSLKSLYYGAKTIVVSIGGCHTSLPAKPKAKRAAKYLLGTMQNLARAIHSR